VFGGLYFIYRKSLDKSSKEFVQLSDESNDQDQKLVELKIVHNEYIVDFDNLREVDEQEKNETKQEKNKTDLEEKYITTEKKEENPKEESKEKKEENPKEESKEKKEENPKEESKEKKEENPKEESKEKKEENPKEESKQEEKRTDSAQSFKDKQKLIMLPGMGAPGGGPLKKKPKKTEELEEKIEPVAGQYNLTSNKRPTTSKARRKPTRPRFVNNKVNNATK